MIHLPSSSTSNSALAFLFAPFYIYLIFIIELHHWDVLILIPPLLFLSMTSGSLLPLSYSALLLFSSSSMPSSFLSFIHFQTSYRHVVMYFVSSSCMGRCGWHSSLPSPSGQSWGLRLLGHLLSQIPCQNTRRDSQTRKCSNWKRGIHNSSSTKVKDTEISTAWWKSQSFFWYKCSMIRRRAQRSKHI